MTDIDAIRYIPNSWDQYQGRVSGEGFAISISKGAFNSLTGADVAITHPAAWVVLPQPVSVNHPTYFAR